MRAYAIKKKLEMILAMSLRSPAYTQGMELGGYTALACGCGQIRTYGDAGQGNDVREQVPSYWLGSSPTPASLTKESDQGEDLVIAHSLYAERFQIKHTNSK